MEWRDSEHLKEWLLEEFDELQIQKIFELYAMHYLLYSAISLADIDSHMNLSKYIKISDYGLSVMNNIDTSEYSEEYVSMACLLVFFHQDFLIDINASDSGVISDCFCEWVRSGKLFLAQRFGRALYDKFSQYGETGRVEHLPAKQTEELLTGSEQGNYQLGDIVVGPMGICRSAEKRLLPPTRRIPLWHCSDPACQALHAVTLAGYRNRAFELASKIEESASKLEGPPSDWERAVIRLGFPPSTQIGRRYYDLVPLLVEALSPAERKTLLLFELNQQSRKAIRETLNVFQNGLGNGSAESVVDRLTEGMVIQALMTLADSNLIRSLDACVIEQRIKIPATEIRVPNSHPTTLSNYDGKSRLSALGIQSKPRNPLLEFSSAIWRVYENLDQLPELAWRCQAGTANPKPGQPLLYIQQHSAHEAVRSLILTSKPIAISLANEYFVEFSDEDRDEEVVDRFLWKFGFTVPIFDNKYERLRSQLRKLREEALNTPVRLADEHRDALRSNGVNAFVSIENFIEEMVAFNIWLMDSDHFEVTKFRYGLEEALSSVSTVLGESVECGEGKFVWNSAGGNTLGGLLVYLRAAANWIEDRLYAPKDALTKKAEHLPHLVNDPAAKFPFIHRSLWADCEPIELEEYAKKFDSIVNKLERSGVAEVRNGLDHYRDTESFPTVDAILSCVTWLEQALDEADLNRFVPKAFWLVQERRNQYYGGEYSFVDYMGRNISLGGPSVFTGIGKPSFSRPLIIPYGNLLGGVNAQIYLRFKEKSEYSLMWADYPKPRSEKSSAVVLDPEEREIEASEA